MGFSAFKEFLSKKTVRAFILMKNGRCHTQAAKYGAYDELSIKGKGYWVDPNAIFRDKKKSYIIFAEDNPFPLYLNDAINKGFFRSEIRSGSFNEAMRTKFIDEVTRAPGQITLLIILAFLNIAISGVIVAKLWGAFDQ